MYKLVYEIVFVSRLIALFGSNAHQKVHFMTHYATKKPRTQKAFKRKGLSGNQGRQNQLL